jgi:hypothetical protein
MRTFARPGRARGLATSRYVGQSVEVAAADGRPGGLRVGQ